MNIRVETSSLASQYQSGVAEYTRLLTHALSRQKNTTVHAHYFNFLHRQPQPKFTDDGIVVEQNSLAPLRIYAKLQSHRLAPPFDTFLPSVDLTIFPNFATWPTRKSALTATVIHDLTYIYYPEVVEEGNLHHLRRVIPRTVRSSDFIITVSESVKAELVKELQLDPERCVVTPVPPSDNFAQKCTPKELDAVRGKYNIGSKDYILFLGNLEPRKNLKTLVEAYRQLPESLRAKYQLVLAGGKGWKTEETQQTIDEAITAKEQVKHIGYIDSSDRPALYQAASLFVMPSLYEGFGVPVLEAMLSSCPVVCSDIPVLRETGGDAAMYADSGDPSDFAAVIAKALMDYPHSEAKMHDNVARFSWDKNVHAIIDKADSLLR